MTFKIGWEKGDFYGVVLIRNGTNVMYGVIGGFLLALYRGNYNYNYRVQALVMEFREVGIHG